MIEGVFINTKFSEDVITIGDLKVNPGRVLNQVSATRRLILITIRGRGVAVVQSVADYEKSEEERAFMRTVVEGLADLEEKREISLQEAKARLGLE
ncbi:MAG: type II toxin-antitoxin system Phd/YefM family antitoxin [Acidobacteria bacterium]|nr:type II toxin-antitoxin system Phd/YefM family antitoxin [Acidobacteriota bacterium]